MAFFQRARAREREQNFRTCVERTRIHYSVLFCSSRTFYSPLSALRRKDSKWKSSSRFERRKVPISRLPHYRFSATCSPASPHGGGGEELELSLNDRSFIAGHRSTRRHDRKAGERGVAAIRRGYISVVFTQLLCGRNSETAISMLTNGRERSTIDANCTVARENSYFAPVHCKRAHRLAFKNINVCKRGICFQFSQFGI